MALVETLNAAATRRSHQACLELAIDERPPLLAHTRELIDEGYGVRDRALGQRREQRAANARRVGREAGADRVPDRHDNSPEALTAQSSRRLGSSA